MTTQSTLDQIEKLQQQLEKLLAETTSTVQREKLHDGIAPGATVTVLVSGTSIAGAVRTRADVVTLTEKDIELNFDRFGKSALNAQLDRGSIALGVVEGIERWMDSYDPTWEVMRAAAIRDARALPESQQREALAAVQQRFGNPPPSRTGTTYRGRWAE